MSTEFIEAFLGESGYADSTKVSYRYALGRTLAWLEDQGLTFDDLDAQRYNLFLASHSDWSNNMRRMYGASLRAFFRWLGQPKHAVFAVLLPDDDAAPGRSLNHVDLRELLASFDTTQPLGWRNLALVAIMSETGLRSKEICRLELARVDMRHRRLTAQVKRTGKKRGIQWREAVFSEDTARFVEMWLAARPSIALKGVGTLFVSIGGSRPGTEMTPDGMRVLFRRWGVKSGIGSLSPHDLRRTMAMLLTEAGAPSRLVQVLGGWDDIRMVERYTRTLQPGQIDRYSPIQTCGLSVDLVEEPVKQD